MRKEVFHEAEGYLWRDNTLFTFGRTLNAAEDILRWLPRLYTRKNNEIPDRPGLCLNGAFVESYYDLNAPFESVSCGIQTAKGARVGSASKCEGVGTRAANVGTLSGKERMNSPGFWRKILPSRGLSPVERNIELANAM